MTFNPHNPTSDHTSPGKAGDLLALGLLAKPSEAHMRTQAELLAYAAFLLSEKNRHLNDIVMIDQKLAALEKKGIVATKEGDWISFEELEAWDA